MTPRNGPIYMYTKYGDDHTIFRNIKIRGTEMGQTCTYIFYSFGAVGG